MSVAVQPSRNVPLLIQIPPVNEVSKAYGELSIGLKLITKLTVHNIDTLRIVFVQIMDQFMIFCWILQNLLSNVFVFLIKLMFETVLILARTCPNFPLNS